MDALRYHPSLKSISLDQNVQVPQIESEDDVIVEVAYAGLCGTDIHIMQVSYRRFFSQFNILKFLFKKKKFKKQEFTEFTKLPEN